MIYRVQFTSVGPHCESWEETIDANQKCIGDHINDAIGKRGAWWYKQEPAKVLRNFQYSTMKATMEVSEIPPRKQMPLTLAWRDLKHCLVLFGNKCSGEVTIVGKVPQLN